LQTQKPSPSLLRTLCRCRTLLETWRLLRSAPIEFTFCRSQAHPVRCRASERPHDFLPRSRSPAAAPGPPRRQ
jgi:hypothetical protein